MADTTYGFEKDLRSALSMWDGDALVTNQHVDNLVTYLMSRLNGKIEVHLKRNKDTPTQCKVFRDGVLIFAGQDYSATVRKTD